MFISLTFTPDATQTGLQCESTMPLSGGLRFACGYTVRLLCPCMLILHISEFFHLLTLRYMFLDTPQMTKAVLGDAIALIRGDRFYTTSYTPVSTFSLDPIHAGY